MKLAASRMMLKRYLSHAPVVPEFFPAADFHWIQTQSKLPWLKLDISVPVDMIYGEIQNLPLCLSEHRDDYGEHQGWRSACIHGKSFADTREDSYYNDNRIHCWTPEALIHMPNTVEYFKTQWPGLRFRRIRLMLLEPGGYITLHKDSQSPGLSPINIAITQPNDCHFVMEKHGRIPFEKGRAFWLDVSNNHVVINDSVESRWHIIVHQDFEDIRFQNLVVNSYHNMYNDIICDKQP